MKLLVTPECFSGKNSRAQLQGRLRPACKSLIPLNSLVNLRVPPYPPCFAHQCQNKGVERGHRRISVKTKDLAWAPKKQYNYPTKTRTLYSEYHKVKLTRKYLLGHSDKLFVNIYRKNSAAPFELKIEFCVLAVLDEENRRSPLDADARAGCL